MNHVGLVSIVLVALSPGLEDEALNEALRNAVRNLSATDGNCRIACATIVPPAIELSGEGIEATATGRHIRRLVDLRRWAKPLELPEERVTYHVLESGKPAAALIDYAKMNDVGHMLIGAGSQGSGARRLPGICAQIVAEAPCSVTVVRARPPG